MTMVGGSGFPKVKPKSDYTKMKQNNITELLGYSFHNIYNNADPPDPLDPKSTIFQENPGFQLVLS